LGFGVTVIEDACRGVNLAGGDVEKALAEMSKRGARIITSNAILSEGGAP